MIHLYKKLTQIYHQIRRPLIHSAIYVSGTLLSGLVSLITFPILARLISVEDMGKYDFFIFMLLSATPFVSFGIEKGLGAFAYKMGIKTIQNILKRILPLSITSSILISIGVVLAKCVGQFQTFSYYLIFLWSLSLIALSSCYIIRAIYIWKQYPVKAAILINGEWITASILGLTFLLISHIYKIEVYLTGLAIAFIVFSFLSYKMWPASTSNAPEDYSAFPLSKILKISFPYGISQALFIVSLGIEKALLLKMLGPYQLGIYAMATKVGSIPKLIGMNIIIGTIPELLQKQDIRKSLQCLMLFLLAYLIVATTIIHFTSSLLIALFGGANYKPAIPILSLAAFSESLTLFPWALNGLMLKRQKTIPILYYGITSTTITVCLGFFLINAYKIPGAIWATIFGKAIGISILLFTMR